MDSRCSIGYVKSSWIRIAGLSSELTEGDIITVFSQFGEVVNINLLRHRQTGKSRGVCFLCYRDLASTILAVDNFNGITLLQKKLKVNYVDQYKVPKYREDADEDMKRLLEYGCALTPIRSHISKKHMDYKRRPSYGVKTENDRSNMQLKKKGKNKKKKDVSNKRKRDHALRRRPEISFQESPPFKGCLVREDVKFKPLPKYSAVEAKFHDVERWKEVHNRDRADFSTEMFATCDFLHVPTRYR